MKKLILLFFLSSSFFCLGSEQIRDCWNDDKRDQETEFGDVNLECMNEWKIKGWRYILLAAHIKKSKNPPFALIQVNRATSLSGYEFRGLSFLRQTYQDQLKTLSLKDVQFVVDKEFITKKEVSPFAPGFQKCLETLMAKHIMEKQIKMK